MGATYSACRRRAALLLTYGKGALAMLTYGSDDLDICVPKSQAFWLHAFRVVLKVFKTILGQEPSFCSDHFVDQMFKYVIVTNRSCSAQWLRG